MCRNESIFDMVRQRSGWLAIFFVGLLLAAVVIEHFEAMLRQHVELSFFLPLLIGEAVPQLLSGAEPPAGPACLVQPQRPHQLRLLSRQLLRQLPVASFRLFTQLSRIARSKIPLERSCVVPRQIALDSQVKCRSYRLRNSASEEWRAIEIDGDRRLCSLPVAPWAYLQPSFAFSALTTARCFAR